MSNKKDDYNLFSLDNLLKQDQKNERQKVKAERKKIRAERKNIPKPADLPSKEAYISASYPGGVKITNMEPETPEHAFNNSITKKQVEEIDAQNKGFGALIDLMDLAEQLKAFSRSFKNGPIQIGTVKEELEKLSGKQAVVDVDDSLDTFFSKMMATSVLSIPEFKFALRQDLEEAGQTEFLPTRSEENATGWDVRCANVGGVIVCPFQYVKIDLGIRGFCPENYWYKLVPRSSTFAKKQLHCLYGTIDEGYEGSLIFAAQYLPEVPYSIAYGEEYLIKFLSEMFKIEFGERIGQIIPVKRQEAKMTLVSNKELDELYKQRGGKRGEGGFGSSGNK